MEDKTATHSAELAHSFPTNQWFLIKGSSISYSVLRQIEVFLSQWLESLDLEMLYYTVAKCSKDAHRKETYSPNTSQYLDLGYWESTMSSRANGCRKIRLKRPRDEPAWSLPESSNRHCQRTLSSPANEGWSRNVNGLECSLSAGRRDIRLSPLLSKQVCCLSFTWLLVSMLLMPCILNSSPEKAIRTQQQMGMRH